MTDPHSPISSRGPRPNDRPRPGHVVPVHVPHLIHEARLRRRKPESTGVRMVLGLAGLASASALATVMLPSILPQPATVAGGVDTAAAEPTQLPEPSVINVTRVVQLAPGQTLPPDVAANAGSGAAPAATPQANPTARPTPRIVYQTITRQSGKP